VSAQVSNHQKRTSHLDQRDLTTPPQCTDTVSNGNAIRSFTVLDLCERLTAHTRATRRLAQCTAVTLVPASLFFASSILSISICFSLSSRLSGSIPSARSPNNKSICRSVSQQLQADLKDETCLFERQLLGFLHFRLVSLHMPMYTRLTYLEHEPDGR
jgi:hypothetical protein